jgi:hypothetical protein
MLLITIATLPSLKTEPFMPKDVKFL